MKKVDYLTKYRMAAVMKMLMTAGERPAHPDEEEDEEEELEHVRDELADDRHPVGYVFVEPPVQAEADGPAAQEQRDDQGGAYHHGGVFTHEELREFHGGVFRVVAAHEVRFTFGHVKGRAVGFREDGGQEDDEADGDGNQQDPALPAQALAPHGKQQPSVGGLVFHDVGEVQRAVNHQHGDDGQAHADFVGDHLGGGTHAAQEGEFGVGGPSGQHQAVYGEGGDGEHPQGPYAEVGHRHVYVAVGGVKVSGKGDHGRRHQRGGQHQDGGDPEVHAAHEGRREVLLEEQLAAVHHGLHEAEDRNVAVQAEEAAQVGDFAVVGKAEVVQRLFKRQV